MFEAIKVLLMLSVLWFAIRHFARTKSSMALRLLFALIFFRFVMASMHELTYPPIIASMSLISLASIGSVVLCFVLLPLVKPRAQPGLVLSKSLLPIYLLISLMLVSAVVNGELKAGLPSFVKWIYLLQLVTLMSYTLNLDGLRKTLSALLVAYSFPILMLVFSVLLGVSKRSELDGSTSFVGGFFHEAVFSTIVFGAAFFAATFVRKFTRRKGLGVLVVLAAAFICMSFVNYRTAILSFMVMVCCLLVYQTRTFKAPQKALIGIASIASFIWLATLDADSFGERFADLPNAYNNASELMTYPENYTRDDRRLFSGRLFMWSGYISEANQGTHTQLLIGRGMGAWKDYFEKYAHNTFVSFYFEIGFLGLILCLAIFWGVYRRLKKVQDADVRSCGLAFLFGFFMLNLGTMPMWSLEGIYCLAFLIALAKTYTLSQRNKRHMVIA